VATRLRIDSIRATTAARSGHPTSAASAADIVAALFFSVMRFDPENPRAVTCDRFVLSKGHAASLLYAAWAAVGVIPRSARDPRGARSRRPARGHRRRAYRRLAVREIPRSGPTRKLLERYGIGRVAIVEAARRMVAGAAPDRAAAA